MSIFSIFSWRESVCCSIWWWSWGTSQSLVCLYLVVWVKWDWKMRRWLWIVILGLVIWIFQDWLWVDLWEILLLILVFYFFRFHLLLLSSSNKKENLPIFNLKFLNFLYFHIAGVSSVPEFTTRTLDPESDCFVIIASDGLWEFCSDQVCWKENETKRYDNFWNLMIFLFFTS